MPRTTAETLAMFGAAEHDNNYTALAELMADDAVYADPIFGPQVGKPTIVKFMEHMEKAVPASGIRFGDWTVTAGETVGYAQWNMFMPNAEGVEVPVPGESLYRLRDDGLVVGVADYIDPVAYNRIRGDAGRPIDLGAAAGVLPGANEPRSDQTAELAAYIESLENAGRWAGTATLHDVAVDAGVGWAQWTFHGEHGDFAGWTLQAAPGERRNLFDTVRAHQLATAANDKP